MLFHANTSVFCVIYLYSVIRGKKLMDLFAGNDLFDREFLYLREFVQNIDLIKSDA